MERIHNGVDMGASASRRLQPEPPPTNRRGLLTRKAVVIPSDQARLLHNDEAWIENMLRKGGGGVALVPAHVRKTLRKQLANEVPASDAEPRSLPSQPAPTPAAAQPAIPPATSTHPQKQSDAASPVASTSQQKRPAVHTPIATTPQKKQPEGATPIAGATQHEQLDAATPVARPSAASSKEQQSSQHHPLDLERQQTGGFGAVSGAVSEAVSGLAGRDGDMASEVDVQEQILSQMPASLEVPCTPQEIRTPFQSRLLEGSLSRSGGSTDEEMLSQHSPEWPSQLLDSDHEYEAISPSNRFAAIHETPTRLSPGPSSVLGTSPDTELDIELPGILEVVEEENGREREPLQQQEQPPQYQLMPLSTDTNNGDTTANPSPDAKTMPRQRRLMKPPNFPNFAPSLPSREQAVAQVLETVMRSGSAGSTMSKRRVSTGILLGGDGGRTTMQRSPRSVASAKADRQILPTKASSRSRTATTNEGSPGTGTAALTTRMANSPPPTLRELTPLGETPPLPTARDVPPPQTTREVSPPPQTEGEVTPPQATREATPPPPIEREAVSPPPTRRKATPLCIPSGQAESAGSRSSRSSAETGSSAQSVVQPSAPWLPPYETFKLAYPDYKGSLEEFLRACYSLRNVAQTGTLLASFLFDDVIRSFLDYIDYAQAGSSPESVRTTTGSAAKKTKTLGLVPWYHHTAKMLRYRRGIVTNENLSRILAFYPDSVRNFDKYMQDSQSKRRSGAAAATAGDKSAAPPPAQQTEAPGPHRLSSPSGSGALRGMSVSPPSNALRLSAERYIDSGISEESEWRHGQLASQLSQQSLHLAPLAVFSQSQSQSQSQNAHPHQQQRKRTHAGAMAASTGDTSTSSVSWPQPPSSPPATAALPPGLTHVQYLLQSLPSTQPPAAAPQPSVVVPEGKEGGTEEEVEAEAEVLEIPPPNDDAAMVMDDDDDDMFVTPTPVQSTVRQRPRDEPVGRLLESAVPQGDNKDGGSDDTDEDDAFESSRVVVQSRMKEAWTKARAQAQAQAQKRTQAQAAQTRAASTASAPAATVTTAARRGSEQRQEASTASASSNNKVRNTEPSTTDNNTRRRVTIATSEVGSLVRAAAAAEADGPARKKQRRQTLEPAGSVAAAAAGLGPSMRLRLFLQRKAQEKGVKEKVRMRHGLLPDSVAEG